MKILCVCFATPPGLATEIARLDSFPPVAANKTQASLVRGLEIALGTPVDLLGVPAVSSFPSFPRLWVSRTNWRHVEKAYPDVSMGIATLPGLKQVTQFAGTFFGVIRWLRGHRRCGKKLIFVHESYIPSLCGAALACSLLGVPLLVLLADPPGGSTVSLRLRRRIVTTMKVAVVRAALRSARGVVTMTKELSNLTAPSLPALLMEGTIDESEGSPPTPNADDRPKTVLYAGLIRDQYGVGLLLRAFRLITSADYRLWIFGRGEDEEMVRRAAEADSRIKYWGFVPNVEVVQREREATVLVNPRPTGPAFTRYSFPSKLLEYMASGTPVITTRLPGIPADYFGHVVSLERETPEELARAIQDVCDAPLERRTAIGRSARRFVLEHKTPEAQGRRIVEFLESLPN